MTIELGYCLICKVKVHNQCGHCGEKKLTDQFTEVEVMWSNGAKMKIGVCVPCALKNAHATEEGKRIVQEDHWKHWNELGGKFDREIVIV